jgi:hypothetical protein
MGITKLKEVLALEGISDYLNGGDDDTLEEEELVVVGCIDCVIKYGDSLIITDLYENNIKINIYIYIYIY